MADGRTKGAGAGAGSLGTRGLTSEEVERRRAAGEVNANTDVKTASVGQIVSKHLFTLFNGVVLALAALVALTGSYENITFMPLVVANFLIGVTQELRAKRMVDKLSILTADKVRVVRDGRESEVGVEELVLDDLVILRHGDQIPADSVVVEGSPEVDEGLLTGESRLVQKRPGDRLLSGSYVATGAVRARVSEVGMDGFAAKINAEARAAKEVESEILSSLRLVIRLATYALVPLGVALFLRTYLQGQVGVNGAILSTVAAVLGMVPQGLVLLTSSVFAIATTRLARHEVLVQQSYCVEALARVDMLCLDKTGTITSGRMEVARELGSDLRPCEGAGLGPLEGAAATVCAANRADANQTAVAIDSYLSGKGVEADASVRVVPFSSERKYSGCVTERGRAFVMGAAQFVLGRGYEGYAASLHALDPNERVICVCEVSGFGGSGEILGEPEVLGFVCLRDEMRPTAASTIEYFKRQGVSLKVISGDDPATVSAIAARAGIEGAERSQDASELRTMEDVRRAARTCNVFGRVTPQQKRSLVTALQEQGHTVAMTGDGVNDVLALRRADCSIAMASGSAASRNIAEIVLVDDDFSHLPQVVAEGRRSINNLQRSASLFLVKTVFSALLALVCLFLAPYPFIPIQMTLVSAAVIGFPSFALALEPNHERVKGAFLHNVLRRSLPASATIVLVVAVTLLLRWLGVFGFEETSTLCMALTGLVGLALIVKISQPMDAYRALLAVMVVVIFFGGCVLFPDLFMIARPTVTMGLYLAAMGVGSIVTFNILYDNMGEGEDGVLMRIARKLEDFS